MPNSRAGKLKGERCLGEKADGSRCTRTAPPGAKYCKQHAGQGGEDGEATRVRILGEICEYLLNGECTGFSTACALAGIPETTVRRWLESDPFLASVYSKAHGEVVAREQRKSRAFVDKVLAFRDVRTPLSNAEYHAHRLHHHLYVSPDPEWTEKREARKAEQARETGKGITINLVKGIYDPNDPQNKQEE